MTRSFQLRFAVALILALLPPAVLLAVLAAGGRIPLLWTVAAIVLGAAGGGMVLTAVAQNLARQAEALEAVARALESGRPPAHLLPNLNDPLGDAQRRLLAGADRSLAEIEALAEQRDEFEAILRSMTEAVVVTGRRGEVVLLNQAARKMFALSGEADYRGRDFVELCRDPRLQEFVARSTAARNSAVVGGEIEIQTPAPRFLRINAAPVHSSRGAAAAAWVLVFYDISQLKSYESLRVDFVANLTHEVRTPLSALCGYAETLLQGVEDPETEKRFLGIIEHQSRRLARLVDDLVALSDLERGLTALKSESIEPRRLVEEAIELMREPANQRGVSLESECLPEVPALNGDRDRLHQVLLNLLDNAIKYTPRGGKVIAAARAAAGNDAEDKGALELVVSDTGEGIPPADIPRLTERFYRVDRARSRELGGTGLGLAIVKHIVQLHGGKLRIESRLSEGTTVTIRLPVA